MVMGFVNVVSSLLVYKYKTMQININFLSIFCLHLTNAIFRLLWMFIKYVRVLIHLHRVFKIRNKICDTRILYNIIFPEIFIIEIKNSTNLLSEIY